MSNTTLVRARRVILGVVALGLVGALAACGTTTVSQDPAAAPVSAPTKPGDVGPTTPAAPAPAPTQDKPSGPMTIEIGKPLTITKNGKDAGTVAVTKVETMTGKQAKAINPFNDDPEHGIYWIVTLSYQATADGFSPGSWDWKVKDDQGQEYESAFIVTKKPDLPSGELHAGEKATGTIIYDAPKTGAHLIYQPMFAGASLATMPLVS
jgi:uncharacterized protein DUF4352